RTIPTGSRRTRRRADPRDQDESGERRDVDDPGGDDQIDARGAQEAFQQRKQAVGVPLDTLPAVPHETVSRDEIASVTQTDERVVVKKALVGREPEREHPHGGENHRPAPHPTAVPRHAALQGPVGSLLIWNDLSTT